jgi:hypothetical protein
MQYLHLVYLAERKRGMLACRGLPGTSPPGFQMPPHELRRLDEEGAFFTDGPYIETKEYPAGSQGDRPSPVPGRNAQ